MATLRMIGVTDDVTVCDCCGKKNLKRTVVLTNSESAFPDSSEVNFYGSQCAVKALKQSGSIKTSKTLTNTEVFKLAKESEQKQKNDQQDELIAQGKLSLIMGRYLLPDFVLPDVINGQWFESEIERRNKIYPCFSV